jgi:glucuronate isomerase
MHKTKPSWELSPERFFDPEPTVRQLARELYEPVSRLPLLCPHGHVDPRLFSDPNYSFGSPVDLLIIPDHYVFRMLYSQGISLESVGVPRLDGAPVDGDHRRIWQRFAENFFLFQGTPTGIWLAHELYELFGVRRKLDAISAQAIYDQITDCLAKPEYHPRALFERFAIETLCTTDAAWDSLEHHTAARQSGFTGRLLPTFRPDGVVNLDAPGWQENISALEAASGLAIHDYPAFIAALEQRRQFFKAMGATATDHAVLVPYTARLTDDEAGAIFDLALRGQVAADDAARFTAHMLMEMARMSVEDGLVMQIHPGSLRNHNPQVFAGYGTDKGADIPIHTEYTRNLKALLDTYGSHPSFTLLLFTLDESAYSRELAPLAGHYPALRIGPPWWFFDSLNGMRRFFDRVVETAGIYNTAGFNDDTRAFCSIPARHDVWRRASANWLAGLVARHILDLEDAHQGMHALAYGLAKEVYRL